MEENKLNARQRRNLKFIEALRTTGSQSNLELKEFRETKNARIQTFTYPSSGK